MWYQIGLGIKLFSSKYLMSELGLVPQSPRGLSDFSVACSDIGGSRSREDSEQIVYLAQCAYIAGH